jgi:thiol-disulfide isomerase/thioredoxin
LKRNSFELRFFILGTVVSFGRNKFVKQRPKVMKNTKIVALLFTLFAISCSTPSNKKGTELVQVEVSRNEYQLIYREFLRSFTNKQTRELELIKFVDNFKVKTLLGKEITLGKGSEKPSVILFFATWCPACKSAIPEIDSVFGQGWEDKINLVAIGRDHTIEELLEWQKKKGIQMEIVADPNSEIFNRFASKFIPRIYVVDSKGEVLFQDYGWGDYVVEIVKLALESTSN